MVPAEFYRDQFGISVSMGRCDKQFVHKFEDTYNWLVNTSDYKKTAKIRSLFNMQKRNGSAERFECNIKCLILLLERRRSLFDKYKFLCGAIS